MTNNINVLEVLESKPNGTKLWSVLFGKCFLDGIDINNIRPIRIGIEKGDTFKLTANAKLGGKYIDGDCLLYPSKEMRDWSRFAWKKGDILISSDGGTDVRKDFSSFSAHIDQFTMNTNLTLDIIEDKSGIKLIGRTDNPYISISNMDGVMFDPSKSKYLKKYYKQKKWSIGPTIGYGLSKDLKLTPYIGIGISYGIIQF